MPAPATVQIVVKVASNSSVGGSGRVVSTTLCPADSSVRTAMSTAVLHAGSTSTPSIGASARTPMRSPNGGAVVIVPVKELVGVGGDHHAAGSCRASTSRAAAVSATVRVSTPLVARPSTSTATLVTKPRVGFRPTRPLHDAGMRIDPAPSPPWAIGAIAAATATPAPLDDPPGVRSGFHGFREMPNVSLSVKGTAPNSDVVVLPSRTKPASTNRCTTGSDAATGSRLV